MTLQHQSGGSAYRQVTTEKYRVPEQTPHSSVLTFSLRSIFSGVTFLLTSRLACQFLSAARFIGKSTVKSVFLWYRSQRNVHPFCKFRMTFRWTKTWRRVPTMTQNFSVIVRNESKLLSSHPYKCSPVNGSPRFYNLVQSTIVKHTIPFVFPTGPKCFTHTLWKRLLHTSSLLSPPPPPPIPPLSLPQPRSICRSPLPPLSIPSPFHLPPSFSPPPPPTPPPFHLPLPLSSVSDCITKISITRLEPIPPHAPVRHVHRRWGLPSRLPPRWPSG